MIGTKLKILCIEDDEDTYDLLSFVFQSAGYEVEICGQPDCLKIIREEKFSAIVLDNYFHDLSGVEICRDIRSFDQNTPVVFLSAEVRQTEIDKAMAAGANAYLTKLSNLENLVATVGEFIKQSQSSVKTEG